MNIDEGLPEWFESAPFLSRSAYLRHAITGLSSSSSEMAV